MDGDKISVNERWRSRKNDIQGIKIKHKYISEYNKSIIDVRDNET